MKNSIRHIGWIALLFIPSPLFAWKWIDLWQTRDQQGAKLFQAGKVEEASQVFKNKDWQAVALYRAKNYTQSYQQFIEKKTSDAQYNAGNAAAYLGRYKEAIDAYDKAIVLNPNNSDAITNREIIKKLINKNKQAQNNTSNNKAKTKQNDVKDNKNNNLSSQQNNGQDNASQENKDKKQKQDTNQQKSNKQEIQNQQAQLSQSSQAQADNIKQMSDKQKIDTKLPDKSKSLANRVQAQDDNKKQLLRSVVDDPGGLLHQKFLRDYLRRHSAEENRE